MGKSSKRRLSKYTKCSIVIIVVFIVGLPMLEESYRTMQEFSLPPPDTEDRLALQKYYDKMGLSFIFRSMGGAQWAESTNWMSTDDDVCEWYGVGCSRYGVVERIKLIRNNVAGSIPTQVGHLSFLRHLEIRGNSIAGSLPSELGLLKRLRVLDLRRNRISGKIPTEIGGLAGAERIYLGENKLYGTIPSEFEGLQKLSSLSLARNNLKGNIPSELGNCPNLAQILVEGNKLSGSLPDELAKSEALRGIFIQGTNIKGPIPKNVCLIQKKIQRFELWADCNKIQCQTEVGMCCTICCKNGEGCKNA